MNVDHHTRARRLQFLINDGRIGDYSLGGVAQNDLLDHDEELALTTLDGEIPVVPFRYVVEQSDGEGQRTLSPLKELGSTLDGYDHEDGLVMAVYDLDMPGVESDVPFTIEVDTTTRVGPRPDADGTVYIDEFPAAQLARIGEVVSTAPDHDERIRLYRLKDGSIDVHQSDWNTNIDPDGTDNG